MSVDLTGIGYRKVGELNGEPVWDDEQGGRWVEYTAELRNAIPNFHAAPAFDHEGKAIVRLERCSK